MNWKPLMLALLVPAVAFAANQTLVVSSEQSRVDIVVKATVDSFTGRLANYQATITADPEAGTVVGATFAFRFADVKTGKDDRDKQMLQWWDPVKHPDGVFTLEALAPAADGRFTAKGTLAMHGVTKAISFPVTVVKDKAVWAIDGEVPLDTREFGLPVIRKLAVLKVDPIVVIRFHLQAALKS